MVRPSFTALALVITTAGALAQAPTQSLAARAQPTQSVSFPTAPLIGSDSCTTPTLLVGNGPHTYDTTGATTGTEGQSTINCIFANVIGIESDVWFEWVAPNTGSYEVSNCGNAGGDTKFAVYSGTSSGTTCPTPGIVAAGCNDDINSLVNTNPNRSTRVKFATAAGKHYLIQVGQKPGTVQSSGTFEFDEIPFQPQYTRYDGAPDVIYRLNNVTDTMWMQAEGDVTTGDRLVTAVNTAAGATFGASLVVDGNPISLGVWEDPNDDGNPNDAVLLATFSSVVSLANTDMLATYTLPTPVVVHNVFFIGAAYSHGLATGLPAPGDTTGCSSRPGQTYLVGNTGPIDFSLTTNSVPPYNISATEANAWLIEAVTSNGSTGIPFCPGDGTATACPCANSSVAGDNVGCLSSLGSGGKLRGMGVPSISADSIMLLGSQMPSSSVLYFQGTTQQTGGLGTAFGDGLRCAGGSVIRLGTTTNVAGSSMYPFGAALAVSVKGAVTTPGVRTYQAWYRNAAAFCTPSTFNLTNGLELTWVP